MLSNQEIFVIQLVDGKSIEVCFLTESQKKNHLENHQWRLYSSETLGEIEGIVINELGEILNCNFREGRAVLFKDSNDFERLENYDMYVVLRGSEKNDRLIYHQLIDGELKIKLIKEYKGTKLREYGKKNQFDVYKLSDGKILVSLVDDEGELYNSMDEYIEIKRLEGNPSWGVMVIPK